MPISPWILPHSARDDGYHRLARTASADVCLPAQLQTTIPECAWNCVQTFVQNNYANHACSSTDNLSFLCTNPTTSGLTIGEGSLQCVISSCVSFDLQTQSGYTICDGMSDAIPNLAETITATLSAIVSLTASEPMSSATPVMSFTAPSAVTTEPLTTAIPYPTASEITSIPPDVASTGVSDGFITSTLSSLATSTPGPTTAEPTLISMSRNSHTTSTGSILHTGSRTSATQTSASGTGTSAAVNVPAEKSTLTTSAIAGIITASVVVVALILGYLAYVLVVKRKTARNRRSQRFSSFFPSSGGDNSAGAGSATIEPKETTPTSPERRFYAGEVVSPQESSLRRQSPIAPHNIGVAVAHDAPWSQGRGESAPRRKAPQQYLTLFPVQPRLRGPDAQQSRWSARSSLEEDLEAQTQDLPILASPRSRSSARSFSSASIPKPLPLRLSKIKPVASKKRNSRIPLTPVYDNGTFDTTIRQVFDDTSIHLNATNIEFKPTYGQVATRSSSRDDNHPFWSQNRRASQRYPIKVPADTRNKSEVSVGSASIYTEIEEDETPEKEEDKQLAPLVPVLPATDRMPLRNLAWPQIPRSASIAKQAEKPHSPRKDLGTRFVNTAEMNENTQRNIQKMPVLTRNVTSSTTIETESSASPVFPLPPGRNSNIRADGLLVRKISDAYKAASSPITTMTPTQRFDNPLWRSNSRSAIRRPGETYQGIQRLRTDRSLPQLYSPPPIPTRSNLRAKITPMTASNGDWYLKVSSPGI